MSEIKSVPSSIRVSVDEWDNAILVQLTEDNEVHIDGGIAIHSDDAEEFADKLKEAILEVLKEVE
jgi:hypothetical protein